MSSTSASVVTVGGDGLGDHLHVQVVAHGGDVAALAGAQQVAGAADLQVLHGDAKARAQLGGSRRSS
jgi:hypothetical protein